MSVTSPGTLSGGLQMPSKASGAWKTWLVSVLLICHSGVSIEGRVKVLCTRPTHFGHGTLSKQNSWSYTTDLKAFQMRAYYCAFAIPCEAISL